MFNLSMNKNVGIGLIKQVYIEILMCFLEYWAILYLRINKCI